MLAHTGRRSRHLSSRVQQVLGHRQLVRQEFYGWMLMHYAVRWLLHHGAARHRIPHEDLSFMGHLQLFRREQPLSGAFPPRAAETTRTLVQ